MSGTTTGRALRYPTATDRVTDGALAVQHLAEDVDGALVKMARKVAIAEMAFAFGGGTTLTQGIVWPAGRFAPGDVPLVVVSFRANAGTKVRAMVTTPANDTGVTVNVTADAALTGTVYVTALGIVL